MAELNDQLTLSITRHDRRTESRRLMRQLRQHAQQIAAEFGLRYRSLDAERPGITEHYGVCYSDGTIRIRLRHAVTGKPLRYSSLIDTVCHELAHLRHFDHGEQFETLFGRMLQWAREQGIYAPSSRPNGSGQAPTGAEPGLPEVRQLPLFGGARLRKAIVGSMADDG